MPGTRVATTGRAASIASRTAFGIPSLRLESTHTAKRPSARHTSSGASRPRKRTRAASPSSCASARAAASPGPVPTQWNSAVGTCSATRAAARRNVS